RRAVEALGSRAQPQQQAWLEVLGDRAPDASGGVVGLVDDDQVEIGAGELLHAVEDRLDHADREVSVDVGDVAKDGAGGAAGGDGLVGGDALLKELDARDEEERALE